MNTEYHKYDQSIKSMNEYADNFYPCFKSIENNSFYFRSVDINFKCALMVYGVLLSTTNIMENSTSID